MRHARPSRGLALVSALAVGGCTTLALAPPQDLNALIGANELTVVQRFGVPTQAYSVGDHKFLSYQRSKLDIEPGVGPWPIWGGTWNWGWGVTEPYLTQFDCDTTFELADGKVLAFTLRGNACQRPFGPAPDGVSLPKSASAAAVTP
jgi:hypothetical protein